MEFYFDFISAVPFFSFNAPFITAKLSGEVLIGKFPFPARRGMRAAFTDVFPLNICVQSSRRILSLCAVLAAVFHCMGLCIKKGVPQSESPFFAYFFSNPFG